MPQVGWDRTGWEAFKYMLFDPDNGTILTRCNLKYKGKYKYTSKLKFTNLFCRTPLSWLKITVFYIIYYTLLACFWIACLVIFFQVFSHLLKHSYWLFTRWQVLYIIPHLQCLVIFFLSIVPIDVFVTGKCFVSSLTIMFNGVIHTTGLGKISPCILFTHISPQKSFLNL